VEESVMDNPTLNDHPIHDLLRKRWSPRAFSSRPVERETLLRLLEAARWAPSSYNEQPWAFILATHDQPAEYARVLGCLIEFNQSWAKAAPVLLLGVAHLSFDRNQQPNRHAAYDLGAAAANLTMQATAEGLFVHQMAGILPDKARTEFHVPEGWDVMTGIAIGYPGDPSTLSDELRKREISPRSRKALASFVFTGAWAPPSTIVKK
jgi:nitroreductase